MRIGISTSVIQRGKTGVAAYIFSLVRALRSQREHQLVLFVLEEDLRLFDFAADDMQIVLVPERFRPPVRDIFWHQFVLPRLAQEHKLDVLHVPSYRRLPWQRCCALVGTVHDLAAFHVSRKYDWKRMFYGRVVAGVLARRQDEIIAVSSNTAKDIRQYWRVPAERLTVIHNGLDHERFSKVSPEMARRTCHHRFGVQQPFFLYVARLEHPGKNHVRLVQAFERFKLETGSPWQLVLAGSNWHGSDRIHETIERSPVRRDIRCPGFVADAELPLLYRAAAAFVYPSLYEGFGFPPLEAMASGCPVLCSTRGALAEVVGDAALTVNPESTDELKFQLVRMAADEELRKELISRGLVRASQFNWELAATKTLRVYARAFQRASNRIERPRRPAQPRTRPALGELH